MKKFIKVIKWFYPGLRIKRWVILLFLSLFLLVFSAIKLAHDTNMIFKIFNSLLFVLKSWKKDKVLFFIFFLSLRLTSPMYL